MDLVTIAMVGTDASASVEFVKKVQIHMPTSERR